MTKCALWQFNMTKMFSFPYFCFSFHFSFLSVIFPHFFLAELDKWYARHQQEQQQGLWKSCSGQIRLTLLAGVTLSLQFVWPFPPWPFCSKESFEWAKGISIINQIQMHNKYECGHECVEVKGEEDPQANEM